MFYASRIRGLSGNFWAAGVVALTSLAQVTLSIWNGVELRSIGQLRPPTNTSAFRSAVVWFSMSAFCDILVTLSMSYYLYKAAKKTVVRRTTLMLTRLITFTVETGFLTAAFAIVEAILFAVSHTTLLYSLFIGVTPKLYSNCLLALLNSRLQISNGRMADSSNVNFITDMQSSSRSAHGSGFNVADVHADNLDDAIELDKVHHQPQHYRKTEED
ncbi:hypothetical protein EIP91_000419 [Steccherinum ochraceum]|uniref:DUF6534 domain-containing protein n=1 Tax=Steccherinum ochraceum TaxID=92696 RepID=A0A4R0RJ94_9APHY|nr:hypothetical protein EIP91_000419 [Steccherinum ochraceum]